MATSNSPHLTGRREFALYQQREHSNYDQLPRANVNFDSPPRENANKPPRGSPFHPPHIPRDGSGPTAPTKDNSRITATTRDHSRLTVATRDNSRLSADTRSSVDDEEENVSPHLLLKSINKYIKKTERQRHEITLLKQENSTYREMLSMADYRIADHARSIEDLDEWFRKLEAFLQQRTVEFKMLNQRHQFLNHDLMALDDSFMQKKQSLLMLKAHTLRVYHSDMASGTRETALQNLCAVVLRILADV